MTMEHQIVRRLREIIVQKEAELLAEFKERAETDSLLDRTRWLASDIENSDVPFLQDLIGRTLPILMATNQNNCTEMFDAIDAFVNASRFLEKK